MVWLKYERYERERRYITLIYTQMLHISHNVRRIFRFFVSAGRIKEKD